MSSGILTLLDGATTQGAGSPVHVMMSPSQAHVFLSGNADAAATVILEGSNQGWVRVKWDDSGECNNYRFGKNGCHDLIVVLASQVLAGCHLLVVRSRPYS